MPNAVDPSGLMPLWDPGTALPWNFPGLRDRPFPLPVSFMDGLTGLLALGDKLRQLCKKCCPDSCGCESDANRIANLLIDVWNDNYGKGPYGEDLGPPDDSVGGHLCLDWTKLYRDALVGYTNWNSTCMSFKVQGVRKDFPGGVPSQLPEGERPVHFWLQITVGECGPGCRLFVDDGFETKNSVHDVFSLTDTSEWTDPNNPPWMIPW